MDRLEKDARFWDRAAEKYAAAKISDPGGYDATLVAVRRHLNADHHVLEVGCGTGSTALQLADSVASYVGTDISPKMIRIARRKAVDAGLDTLRFEVAVSNALQTDAKAVDTVLAFNLLHHVPDPRGTLAAIHARLKPGGLFISKTPCLALMNPLIRLAIPVMQRIGKAPSVTSFEPDELKRVVTEAGFKIEACEQHGTKGKDVRRYIVARRPS